MKIAFVGKGGSGKTTLTALLGKALAREGLAVLGIDADINQHLAEALGMDREDASKIPHLGNEITRIKEYCRGSNPRIASASEMIKTTPPGSGSKIVRLGEKNPLLEHFSRTTGGVRIMATGPFTEEDLGVKCYHSKTGSVELLLNHLADGKQDYVLVDMTAGADSFASGLFTRFDATFVVVEPTQKSLGVYSQYQGYARPYGVQVHAVGNKVSDARDESFLRGHLGEALVATIPFSSAVRRAEQGESLSLEECEEGVEEGLATLRRIIETSSQDREAFYRHMVEFHRKNAESWGNALVGKDLALQIDPDFDFLSTAK